MKILFRDHASEEIRDFISFDWANESIADRIFKLNDGRQARYVVCFHGFVKTRLISKIFFSLKFYKEEIEAYSENTDEPIRKSFNVYVKLALHILNLLPIDVQCLIDVC